MPDFTAITQALGALKAVKDIGEATIGLANAAAFRERQIEFQGKIIEAQDGIFAMQQERTALIEKISELEKEITNLKAWDTEKNRYKLVEVGPGAFARVIKPEAQGSEPEHLICTSCYENWKKSILQADPDLARTFGDIRVCPACGCKVHVARNPDWKPAAERRWP